MAEPDSTVQIRFFGGECLTLESSGPITTIVVGEHKLGFSPDGFYHFMEIMKKHEKKLKRKYK